MRSTDQRPTMAVPSFENRFEELRIAYLVRLAADRDRLMMLHARFGHPYREAVGHPYPEAAGPYDDIQRIAHAMAGAAAIFSAPQVGSAARLLEEAAAAAVHAPDGRTGAAVRAALEVLMELLPAGEA